MSFWFNEKDRAGCFTLIVLLSVFCICRSRRIGLWSANEVSPGQTYLLFDKYLFCKIYMGVLEARGRLY